MSDNYRERFQTHANYLEAFAYLATDGSNRGESTMLSGLRSRLHNAGCGGSGAKSIDKDQIQRSLRNAWGTELLLRFGQLFIKEDELVRISNNWAVVQTYYVFYHATQALAGSYGSTRVKSHPKTQSQFQSLWGQRKWSLIPWSLSFSSRGIQKAPTGAVINDQIY